MPDAHRTDLPARTLTPAQVHAARLRVATASRVAFPDEDDPRAVCDCGEILAMLGIGRDE